MGVEASADAVRWAVRLPLDLLLVVDVVLCEYLCMLYGAHWNERKGTLCWMVVGGGGARGGGGGRRVPGVGGQTAA